MEPNKKQIFIEILRVGCAVLIFLFGMFVVIYKMENPDLTITEVFLKVWKYGLILIIINAGLEALRDRAKD